MSHHDNIHSPNYSEMAVLRIRKTLLLAILLLLLPLSFSMAQSGGFSGAFSRMGFGPRGMAMGNALGALPEEGVYAHYNPALAAFVGNNQIDMSTALMSFDRSLHALNVTFPLPPNAGLNIGLLNAGVTDIDGRTSSGYHTEYLSTHEYQLFAGFGINISPKVKAGASVKLHMADYHDDISNATGAGFDLGIIAEPTSSWRLGFAVQDMISEYSWNTVELYGSEQGHSRNDPVPVRFRLSTSYFLLNKDLAVSSEFEVQRQSAEYQRRQVASGSIPPQSITSTDDVLTSSQLFRVGVTWNAHERITLRGGWEIMDLEYTRETQKFSTGFSVHLPYDALNPSVDYAYVREPMGISGIHVMALRFSL